MYFMKSETVKATELCSSQRDFSSTMLADPYMLLWRCLPAIDFVELSLWHFQNHLECSHSMAAILRLAVLLEAYASECCDS